MLRSIYGGRFQFPAGALVVVLACASGLASGMPMAEESENLEARLQGATGTERVDLLNEMAVQQFRKAPSETLARASAAHELAVQLEYAKGEAAALANLAMYHYVSSDHQQALELFERSFAMFERLGDERAIARIQYTRGLIHRGLGNMAESFDQLERALETRLRLGDKKGVASCYNGMGINYRMLADYERAIEYLLLSLELKEEIGDPAAIATSLHNIGLTYKNLEEHDLALDICSDRSTSRALSATNADSA